MRKIKRSTNVIGTIMGFVLFLLTIMVTSSSSIFIYHLASEKSGGNIAIISLSVFGIIVFGALLCTLFDVFRRKYMVEKPTNKILEATQKITSGNFNIKIEHNNEYDKYNEYDLIFDNINTMAAELAKNEILKNDFISNVSHEIKTPIAVIQNYAKALQNDNISKEKKNEYLVGLIIQTTKLSNLISNILKLNKLENQEIVPAIETFDLAELVRETTLTYENIIEKKNLELECNIDDLIITSSQGLLEIVLNNLISNAIKFTDANGKIKISLTKNSNYAVIKISDTGCGISPETGKHIFDKFYQGDTSRASEGNGLGLALVKKVIDILGGEILVESTLGKGSTFTVKLKMDL